MMGYWIPNRRVILLFVIRKSVIDYLPANVRKSLRKPATAKKFLEIPCRPTAPPFRRPERASLHPGESLREVLNLKKCLFRPSEIFQRRENICFGLLKTFRDAKTFVSTFWNVSETWKHLFRPSEKFQRRENICFDLLKSFRDVKIFVLGFWKVSEI